MKASKQVNGPGSMKNALSWAERCLGKILAGGGTGSLVVVSYDGPTDEMRGKLHAMAGDLARQARYFRGADMGEKISHREDSWKAVAVSAAAGDRFVPGYNGGLISVRPSSENLSQKKYSIAIEALYQIGAEIGVVWSEPEANQ